MPDQPLTEQQYRAFLEAPPLLAGYRFSLFQGIQPEDKTPLPQKEPKGVFGRKMESFLSHYLQTSGRYELLAENLQIIRDGITLGELDFLVRDLETQQVLHIEMACKFYLLRHRKASAWVGPNHRDWLHLKLRKLYDHQFPMLYRPETKRILKEKQVNIKSIRQQLHLPGLLFTPMRKEQVLSPEFNQQAIGGHWMRKKDFRTPHFGECYFSLPPKGSWLLKPADYYDWMNMEQTQEQLAQWWQRRRSPMLWVRWPDQSYTRIFVVWW